MRFSLLTMLVLTAYAAICSTVFVYANLWFGTLVVAATVLWLGVATVKAVKSQKRFLLGFSIAGWSWTVLWLGFVAETDRSTADWPVPRLIRSLTMPIKHPALDAGNGEAKLHSLLATGPMMEHKTAPSWHNLMRSAVCISALMVGCACGILYHLIGPGPGSAGLPRPQDVG